MVLDESRLGAPQHRTRRRPVDGNYVLFTVAVFSGYRVPVGYRVLSRKRPTPGEAAAVDWTAHLVVVVFGVGMVAPGGYDLAAGDRLGTAPILLTVVRYRRRYEIRTGDALEG